MPTRIVLAAALVFAGSPVLAQEWTRFRGPNGTGVGDGSAIPASWTEADYNWRVELPGGGHSSPVLWGDRIFLLCADDETALRMLVCLSAEDGRVLWRRDFESQPHVRHKFNSFASTTPCVDQRHVYVCWSTPESYTLRAFDHDGNDVWQRDLGAYESQHSCGTSPIVYEDLVVLGNDQDGPSFLIAVDRATGETRWQAPRRHDTVAYSTPCVHQPPGGTPELIFNSGAHGITAVDPRTGQTVWEAAGVFSLRSCSSPIVAGGLVFGSCGSGAGGNYVVAVRPGTTAAPDAELAYTIDRSAPYVPTPLARGDLVFLWGDLGMVSCIDAASGALHWRERVEGNFFGSPVLVEDRVYCLSVEGDAVVLAASDEFELLARVPLGEYSHATPAVAGGRMYLRTYSHLMSLGGE